VIQLTWRQFRAQALMALAALACVAAVVAVTGPRLSHLYGIAVAPCQAQGNCKTAVFALTSAYGHLGEGLSAVLLAVPALIGIFWGAPLVAHELETGTYRLAWTQGVTRQRWLAVKLGLPGLAGMAAAGLFSLLVSWWAIPLDRVNGGRFTPGNFAVQGIVPIGYAAFAFALGVAAGVLTRRTLPAMAASLAAFAGARLAIQDWVRPHLAASAHLSAPLNLLGFQPGSSGNLTLLVAPPNSPRLSGAWIYSTQVADKTGYAPTSQFLQSACPNLSGRGGPPGPDNPGRQPSGIIGSVGQGQGRTSQNCLHTLSARVHDVVMYQPASRYWLFQAYETAIFIGLAVALAGLCFWWVRRRLT
jgi:hypothetical protein